MVKIVFPSRKKKSRTSKSRRSVNPLDQNTDIRSLLTINLIILSTTISFLIISALPILDFIFETLWIYSFDNINIETISVEDIATGIDVGTIVFGSTVLEQFIETFFIGIVLLALPDALWIGTLIARVVRLVYLLIIGAIVLYSLVFAGLSSIMNRKVRFTVIFLSTFASTLTTLAIVFFLIIPNNNQLIASIADLFKEVFVSGEIFENIPALGISFLNSMYLGFFIAILIHFGITVIVQWFLRDF